MGNNKSKQDESSSPISNELVSNIRKSVKDYYSLDKLETYDDFETGLDDEDSTWPTPPSIGEALAGLNPEVSKRFIGCGLNTPECWQGLNIVELGCGCGRDSFFMSKLIGQEGSVLGLDLGEERIEFCTNQIPYHMEKYGYSTLNVTFKKSLVEDMKDCGVKSGSLDLVTANCCIVLCPDPESVFRTACDVLKVGGEMYFTEVYAQTPPPKKFYDDPVLMCEGFCAQSWEQFLVSAQKAGFTHPRLLKIGSIVIGKEVREKLGSHEYLVAAYRMFKIPPGNHKPQKVTYNGGIPDHEDSLRFDHATIFRSGESLVVDGELGATLKHSRHAPFFTFEDSDAPIQTQHPKLDPFVLEKEKQERDAKTPKEEKIE